MTGIETFGIAVLVVFVIYCIWEAQAVFARVRLTGTTIKEHEDGNPILVLAIRADEPEDLTDLHVELKESYTYRLGHRIKDSYEESNTYFHATKNIEDGVIGYEQTGFVYIAKNKSGRLVTLLDPPIMDNPNNYEYIDDDDETGKNNNESIEITREMYIEVKGKILGKAFFPKKFHDVFQYWSLLPVVWDDDHRHWKIPENILPEDSKICSGIHWKSEIDKEAKERQKSFRDAMKKSKRKGQNEEKTVKKYTF